MSIAGTAYNPFEPDAAAAMDTALARARVEARSLKPVAVHAPMPPPAELPAGTIVGDPASPQLAKGIIDTEQIRGQQVTIRLSPTEHRIGGCRYTAELEISKWPDTNEFQWPGFTIAPAPSDWRESKGVGFAAYNPSDHEAEIGLSITGADKGEWYQYFRVPASSSKVIWVWTRDLADKLDIARVKSVFILMRRPPRDTLWYVTPVVLAK